MSTKEEINKAAAAAFRRKEVKIAPGVTVTVRELSRAENRALQSRLWVCGPNGRPEAKDGRLTPAPGVDYEEEWLAATLEPAYTVQELRASGWSSLLWARLMAAVESVNDVTVEEAAKNS